MRLTWFVLAVILISAGCLSKEPKTETPGNGMMEAFDPASHGSPHPKVPSQHPPCCSNPFWHRIYSASSPDGIGWHEDGILIKNSASVPEPLLLDNGTTMLYYVDGNYDTMDCLLSVDGRTFSYGNCTIYGFTEKLAWDPDVVKMDGIYRMYFFAPSPQGKNRIMSAISKDGVNWLQEPGVRFAHEDITDPSVVKTNDGWRMYIFHGDGILVAKSDDGIDFVEERELDMGGGVVDVVSLDRDGYAMYLDCIEMATSIDGIIWTNRSSVLRAGPGFKACSPGIIKAKDGWKMYYQIMNATT